MSDKSISFCLFYCLSLSILASKPKLSSDLLMAGSTARNSVGLYLLAAPPGGLPTPTLRLLLLTLASYAIDFKLKLLAFV